MINGAEKVLEKITRLNSERIILRKFTQDDAEDVLEYGSDPETMKWLFWAGVSNIEGALEAINGYYSSNAGVFAIELKNENKCIGCIDLRLDTVNEKAGFGYVLNRKYWNKGYMTDALRMLLNLAFHTLDLNRVESTHFVGNEASGRVMEKCGMKKEGVFPQSVKVKGVFHDVVHYGILKSDLDIKVV